MNTAEHRRLAERSTSIVPPWRRWGCYVSERSWGTVREDYSAHGDAWNFLPHDKARSKAYRWGEDGIAGLCDRYQLLVFAPAFWNGRDPILKERMFGLTSSEGNRGEDVKDYYFYVDATPTGSYMKLLYKYPQREYPYANLLHENRRRGGGGMEYELLDTGVFADDAYFDIVIEYAKNDPEDICIRIEAFNRGAAAAELHVIPQLWFRNTWAWGAVRGPQPRVTRGRGGDDWQSLVADDSTAQPLSNLMFEYRLGARHLYGPPGGAALFTDNETNAEAVYGPGNTSASAFTKDAFHRQIVYGHDACNPEAFGTKACLHYRANVPAHGLQVWEFRLSPNGLDAPLREVEEIVQLRRQEADEFYAAIHPPKATGDEKLVQRQA